MIYVIVLCFINVLVLKRISIVGIVLRLRLRVYNFNHLLLFLFAFLLLLALFLAAPRCVSSSILLVSPLVSSFILLEYLKRFGNRRWIVHDGVRSLQYLVVFTEIDKVCELLEQRDRLKYLRIIWWNHVGGQQLYDLRVSNLVALVRIY